MTLEPGGQTLLVSNTASHQLEAVGVGKPPDSTGGTERDLVAQS